MPPPRRLPLLLLALTSVSSQKEGGGESLGGGLPGKVFGLGAPGAGNGMDHAFDGKTDTWFDCVAPPEDIFPDACYVGLELKAPSAIGAVRFFPRGVCPGCDYGGSGYKNACPGSTPAELKGMGACRMLGPEGHRAMFQGAASQSGPWTTFATIAVKPAETAWTTLESTDTSTSFAFVRYHSPKGGFCNVAEVEFYPPSRLGWTLSAILLLGGAAYVAGGVALGKRAGGKAAGLPAHPHYGRWLVLRGLCTDGVRFARSGGQAHPTVAAAAASERPGGYVAAPDGDGRTPSPTKEAQKKEKKEKSSKRKGKQKAGRAESHGAGGGGDGPPSTPAQESAPGGTVAGGGGRWVRVPS
jgi:hypothetical protein